jgi:hypothetical protein
MLKAESQKYVTKGNNPLSDDVIEQLLNQVMIAASPLVVNKKETNWVAVNLYTDDQGIMKNLPANRRASDISVKIGRPLQVNGDAFVARYYDDDKKFTRMDFTLADLSADVSLPCSEQVAAVRVNNIVLFDGV